MEISYRMAEMDPHSFRQQYGVFPSVFEKVLDAIEEYIQPKDRGHGGVRECISPERRLAGFLAYCRGKSIAMVLIMFWCTSFFQIVWFY